MGSRPAAGRRVATGKHRRGRVCGGLQRHRQALAITAPPGQPALPVAGIGYVGLAEVAYQRNELEAALQYLSDGIPLCRQFNYTQPLATGLATLAWIRQASGDPGGALEAIGEAERAGPAARLTVLLNPVPALRARLLLAQGDLAAAARWAEEHGLGADDEPDYPREREYLVLARALIAEDRPRQALALLERLHVAAAAQDRTGSIIEIGALRALVFAAAGDQNAAVDALARQLSRDECLRLLASVPVGRVIYARRALPAVELVNFALDQGDIVIRTDRSDKLAAAARGAVVAFEADCLDPAHQAGWSVTAMGPSREVTDPEEIGRLQKSGQTHLCRTGGGASPPNGLVRPEVAGRGILPITNGRVPGGHAGDGGEQAPDIVLGGVDARAGPDSARHRAAVTAPHLVAVRVHLRVAEAEQPDQVRMGAEAAVPDADRLLGRQPRRHKSVRHAVNHERGDRQRLGAEAGAEQANSGDACQPASQRLPNTAVMSDDRGPADGPEPLDGRVQRDRADHIGRASFLPLGRVRPHDLVQVDQVHRTAAGQERVAVGEDAPRADEHAGAERGVHLVPAPRQEVSIGGQRAVRGQLGGVDQDGSPAKASAARRAPS